MERRSDVATLRPGSRGIRASEANMDSNQMDVSQNFLETAKKKEIVGTVVYWCILSRGGLEDTFQDSSLGWPKRRFRWGPLSSTNLWFQVGFPGWVQSPHNPCLHRQNFWALLKWDIDHANGGWLSDSWATPKQLRLPRVLFLCTRPVVTAVVAVFSAPELTVLDH